jgi:hypothetical protein
MGAYISQETKSIVNVTCVCEQSEWDFLEKTRRETLPNDRKLLKHMWERESSLNQLTFGFDYSSYLNFKKIQVLSPLVEPLILVPRLSDCEINCEIIAK